mmetsp:Transcript_10689/g.17954  ORF Transcript_10689/g.17954 Transcript_10689/m.17954 type:complete len:118 (+) Transcript_10689:977-1330(+)
MQFDDLRSAMLEFGVPILRPAFMEDKQVEKFKFTGPIRPLNTLASRKSKESGKGNEEGGDLEEDVELDDGQLGRGKTSLLMEALSDNQKFLLDSQIKAIIARAEAAETQKLQSPLEK